STSRVTLLLFGDVNLGRALGRELLKGNVDYPFAKMNAVFRTANEVFVNLESPITEQNGETESKASNFVFCAPPVAAAVLKRAGVTIVSTANNHVFDYSLRGLLETMENLRREGVRFVGTYADSVRSVPPVIVKRNGITLGFLAYTQLLNAGGPWQGRIAVFDSIRARRDIRTLRRKSDVVIVSFHGGREYAENPDRTTLAQMHSLIDAGADVVVGHHPHVPQGIEEYKRRLIFHSLGNLVFNQAEPWAKRSFGVELSFSRNRAHVQLASARLIPLRAYKQPAPDLTPSEIGELVDRTRRLSNIAVTTVNDSIVVSTSQLEHFR
ncbi:MAG TPA: CapA family protein, partial [Bacteroidota bacterium]